MQKIPPKTGKFLAVKNDCYRLFTHFYGLEPNINLSSHTVQLLITSVCQNSEEKHFEMFTINVTAPLTVSFEHDEVSTSHFDAQKMLHNLVQGSVLMIIGKPLTG